MLYFPRLQYQGLINSLMVDSNISQFWSRDESVITPVILFVNLISASVLELEDQQHQAEVAIVNTTSGNTNMEDIQIPDSGGEHLFGIDLVTSAFANITGRTNMSCGGENVEKLSEMGVRKAAADSAEIVDTYCTSSQYDSMQRDLLREDGDEAEDVSNWSTNNSVFALTAMAYYQMDTNHNLEGHGVVPRSAYIRRVRG
ncbi:uncharacterized protein F5147DRAFT_760255 [Suillus discolor]|uniref:Uncharacterized protein n=1 Tax=Suillus discolor TaxID=1912936 RepID=A0A9P7F8V4_9AGAM|nr:uncharacterized protein F5147DRAFT_760255 [Suillus discolor]KAG2110595.1 hypothetical protein F5147DRAFT_760255 [Suillus discolor]